jgi:hypothetical protein
MWGKFKLMCVLLMLIASVNVGTAQDISQKSETVRLSVDNGFFSSNNGRMCQTSLAFIVNNSNDTLTYWGHDVEDGLNGWLTNYRQTDLFTISKNKFMRLGDTDCIEPLFKRKTIPPHRSQLIPLKLFLSNTPNGIIRIKIDFKLYRRFGTENFEESTKNHVAEILTDSVILKFDNGNTVTDWEKEAKKIRSIPPITDLHLLTDEERKHISITVDQTQVKRSSGRRYSYIKGKVFLVHAVIHNKSDKVLKYLSRGESPEEYYHVDNQNFKIPDPISENNSPIIVTIPPNEERTEIIPIIFKVNKLKYTERLKVGININEDVPNYLSFFYFEGLKQFNIIWSNEVQFVIK